MLITFNVSSQEIKTVFDVGLWSGIGVDYELNKKYSVSFKQELRLYESFQEIEKIISDAGVEYKINKEFGIGSNVRYYLDKHNDNVYANDFRISFDFKYKKKINKELTFKYRLRYQDVYESLFDEVSEGVVNTFRNKIAIDYSLARHKIYFKAEIFRKRTDFKRPYFNKFRLGLGDEVETKLGDFDYSLAYERELGVAYPLDFVFLRVYYTFKIKK